MDRGPARDQRGESAADRARCGPSHRGPKRCRPSRRRPTCSPRQKPSPHPSRSPPRSTRPSSDWCAPHCAQPSKNAKPYSAGVSHDMRTPISRLRFALELYGEGAAPRLLDEIEHELQDLEQAATRFIAYARSNFDLGLSTSTVPDRLVTSSNQLAQEFEGNVVFRGGRTGPCAPSTGQRPCTSGVILLEERPQARRRSNSRANNPIRR